MLIEGNFFRVNFTRNVVEFDISPGVCLRYLGWTDASAPWKGKLMHRLPEFNFAFLVKAFKLN